MAELRRTKKIIVLEDIIDRMTHGGIESGSFFPGANELARNYGISVRTAGAIISELSRRKLLKTSPGRRSQVTAEAVAGHRPKFARPIGIISPSMELMQVAPWREWLFRHLQSRLLADGYPFLWLPETVETEEAVRECSGIVVAGELLLDQRWERLRESGLPCVRLSFFRPTPDTVYVDYRPALDRVALYLAGQKCRRMILLACCERESQYAFRWFSEIGLIQTLQAYNIDEQGFHRVVVSGDNVENIRQLRAILAASTGKIAILACNPVYDLLIADLMKMERLHPGTDYELVSLSYAPGDRTTGRHIDLKCPEIVDRMLEILYAPRPAGDPRLGRIVFAEFSGGPA